MNELLVYALVLGAAVLVAAACYPLIARWWTDVAGRVTGYQQVKIDKATQALDDIFVDVKPKWLKAAYGLSPIGAGLISYLVFDSLIAAGVGAVAGVILPDVWVRQTKAIHKRRFRVQLVDALFVLSSSLKAGLSLTQAFEVLESEMGPPASQEFGLVVKAHRVGRTLENALQSLNERMACEELELITTALLVARETGGDVTNIISQLIGTIREKKKLDDKVNNLTMQGRMQAYLMSLLPIGFAFFVKTFNPHYFDIMFQEPLGMKLVWTAGGLWVVGMFLLMKMSKVDI